MQRQLNITLGFCAVLYGGLLVSETVSTGSCEISIHCTPRKVTDLRRTVSLFQECFSLRRIAEKDVSVATQVVQAYAPVGTAGFGDGRVVVVALEAKHWRDGESRMQELHDQVANLQVTAADKYDLAREIQEVRRVCAELEALGDVVVPARKTHAFFRALPDEKYESLKTALLCHRQRDGSSSTFEDIAAHATSYHAMQFRDKITATDERAGGENDAGSHESASNTTAHVEPRNSRRNNGRGQGRGYRGNGNTSSSTRSNNRNDDHMSTSNGNSSDDSNTGRREHASERSHRNQASGRGGRQRGRNDGKNRHGRYNILPHLHRALLA